LRVNIAVALYPYDDARPEQLPEAARRAEQLGFDGVFAFDHVLKAEISYRKPFLDPHTLLTAAGAVTQRVKLGTDIVVLPIRHPVLVAKTLAAMDHLFPDRVISGIGTGWNVLEYEAVGLPIRDRFDRMEEAAQALRVLLHDERATFEGDHFSFRDVELKPFAAGRIPIWVGSGSSSTRPVSDPDRQQVRGLSRRGARRIALQDGWILPPTATAEIFSGDWRLISEEARALGKDPETLDRAALDFCYLVVTNDREEALEQQRPIFGGFLGYTKTWEYVQQHNLVGTPDDIARRMVERTRAVGLTWWIIHMMHPDPDQLDGWAEEIVPRFERYLAERPR
jgi:alkanesulfonate monooxygenase SsuD/methylene tetrahydromethanopterin reductase-like flavin-dependent oxidoreductase (luciferase family)